MMLLIGMLIARESDDDPGTAAHPAPSVMAAEQETGPPAADLQSTDQDDVTEPPTRLNVGTKTEYSTCLVRTQKSLLLDIEDARFTPWPDFGDNRSVWDIIRYRYIEYIGETLPGRGAATHFYVLQYLHPKGIAVLLPETRPRRIGQ